MAVRSNAPGAWTTEQAIAPIQGHEIQSCSLYSPVIANELFLTELDCAHSHLGSLTRLSLLVYTELPHVPDMDDRG